MNNKLCIKKLLPLTLALFTCFSSLSSAMTVEERRMLQLGDTISISNNNYYRQFRENTYYSGSSDYFVDKYGVLRKKNEYYIDQYGKKQNYYDEYFVDSMGNTIYPYKGYYYDRNNNKRPLNDLQDYNFNYYRKAPDSYYGDFIDDVYSKRRYHTSYYFDTENNLRRVYRNMDKYDYRDGYYIENPRYYNNAYRNNYYRNYNDQNYLLYAVSSLPAKFPIGSKDWPDKSHYSVNKEDISKNLAKEAEKLQDRYGKNFFEERFIETMLRTYFDIDNNKYIDDLTDFMYYLGFTDDFVDRYTDNPNDKRAMEIYLKNEGNDLYLLYRDYYHDYISYYDINKAYDNKDTVRGNFFINPYTNMPYDVYPDDRYYPYPDDIQTYNRIENTVPNENYYFPYGSGQNSAYVTPQDIIQYERNHNQPYNSNVPANTVAKSNITLNAGNNIATISSPNGVVQNINMSVAPRIIKDEMYIPIGLIGSYLNLSVSYNNNEKSTEIQSPVGKIKVYSNSNTIILPGGATVNAEKPTTIVESRLLIPSSYLNYLGYSAGYNMINSGTTIIFIK